MLLTFFFISSIPQVAKCDIMDSVNSELTGDFHDTVEVIGTAEKNALNISKTLLNLLIQWPVSYLCLLGSPPEMVFKQSVYLYVNSNNPKNIKSTIRTFNYLLIV